MRELEERIARWRAELMRESAISNEEADELEDHLRLSAESWMRSGLAAPEAFDRAVAALGSGGLLGAEFVKLGETSWLPLKVAAVIGAIVVVGLAAMLGRLIRSDALLAAHVFLITLGYTGGFLSAAIGICFVGQRCFSGFTQGRTRFISRWHLRLNGLALGLTLAGTILGAIWAEREWGQYWGWRLKEVGGLGVIVWLAGLTMAQRLCARSPQRVLTASVLGFAVIGLAWFGPALAGSYGSAAGWRIPLVGLAALSVAAFGAGQGPAGWLRARRA